MVKLTYTNEMQEQDALWDKEMEDAQLMASLHLRIILEAITLDFPGVTESYIHNNEALTEVYASMEEKQLADDGKLSSIDCFSKCSELINALEQQINATKERV